MARSAFRLCLCLVAAWLGVMGWLGVARLAALPAGGEARPARLPAEGLRATHSLSDTLPGVLAFWPPDGATDVSPLASLVVTFTEPVALDAGALRVVCERAGALATSAGGGPTRFDFTLSPPPAPADGCEATVLAERVWDMAEPPNGMPFDVAWRYRTGAPLLINEVDAAGAPGGAAFVELYDGGRGGTALAGLSVVLYDGGTGVYLALGLDGQRTDNRGYLVIGTAATAGVDVLLADEVLREGPAAVALYQAPPNRFPRDAPVTTEGLLDAVVYGGDGEGVEGLLLPGQLPVDEAGRGQPLADSVSRCPNGAGDPRATDTYRTTNPTPDVANACQPDDLPPEVATVWPADGTRDVPADATIAVNFSEPVTLVGEDPVTLNCAVSGARNYGLAGQDRAHYIVPLSPLPAGETCEVLIKPAGVHDNDSVDPPDELAFAYRWSFTVAPAAPEGIIINELDADTPGVDAAEFIELFDGGVGRTALDGLVVVLFNGSDDVSYRTIDLTGHATDADGYFVLGNEAVASVDLALPDGLVQNGPDAVAIVAASATSIANGTPVADVAPVDAIVYGPADAPDDGLLPLLLAGQPQLDEDARDNAEAHSQQRCPNGAGGVRQTVAFRQNTPTPGAASDCLTDAAPYVAARLPKPNAEGMAPHTTIQITFSEPVATRQGWVTLTCSQTGDHDFTKSGGPVTFALQSTRPFAPLETCTVSLKARYVTDLDADDPPDKLAGNISWRFTIAPPVADFVVINELDPDTPSSDAAEFIELYDGGRGHTDLSGLTLVFYNGYTNGAYHAIDLDGQRTDAHGYWLGGNTALNPALVFTNGTLQNGPDAIALYAGDATQFNDGALITGLGLLDAVVYGDADDAPPGLLSLLFEGEKAVDEAARGAADAHALQRCPNGAGGQRRTAAFLANTPSPGETNNCATDNPPNIAAVWPSDGARDISTRPTLSVSLSEPVTVEPGWLSLNCSTSGAPALTIDGGPTTFRAKPPALRYDETCTARVLTDRVHDADTDDPPDSPAADHVWTFSTGPAPAAGVLINEFDADTPGRDTAEFIELTDGGAGNTSLAGLTLVLFNGHDDRAYAAIDLDGVRTGADGLALLAAASVPGGDVILPDGLLQNGADAIALYEGNADDFPDGTALTTPGLRDAAVYGTTDALDSGLLALLEAGEPQIDEAARGAAESHASQRCPDGAGGPRRTSAYRANAPTPGAANNCRFDDAPTLVSVAPADSATGVDPAVRLVVTFNEPVNVEEDWLTVNCAQSGPHAGQTSAGASSSPAFTPNAPFTPGETCTADLRGTAVHDADSDDPPDTAEDFRWQFAVAIRPPDGILINEVDANTPGSDTAEFIELYDGGRGRVDLSGLVLVLWNGEGDVVYRAIDLAGQQTNAGGYFVLGNGGVSAADLPLPDGALQNGPDAVGLYIGRADDFPAGLALTTAGLRDALVYGPASAVDPGLLPLLLTGESQADEAGRGDAEGHALQRCPNGAGLPRTTATTRPGAPTPGTTNACASDTAPAVVTLTPADGAAGVAADAALTVEFSEPMAPAEGWFEIECEASGRHDADVTVDARRFTLTPQLPFAPGELCEASLYAAKLHDADADDPPDTPAADVIWRFQVALPPPEGVLINEVDSDTPGRDTAEFVELYDGGRGDVPLTGLALVFYNGSNDRVYYSLPLGNARTDAQGYAVIGGEGVPGRVITLPPGLVQNGADAVALYAGSAASFPPGATLTLEGLRDAIVYGAGHPPDEGLLPLLLAGETQADEGSRGDAPAHALQRCPNGAGQPRATASYRPGAPTPGSANACDLDEAPTVVSYSPGVDAQNVARDTAIVIAFSEPMAPAEGWFEIDCDGSGRHTADVTIDGTTVTLKTAEPFAPDETCTVTLFAAHLSDADPDDPPDTLAANVAWRFHTRPPVAANLLINELDADTPGADTAEFIELFDGGAGHTPLDGLALVLWNGKDDTAYRVLELTGQTDAAGYFVIGSAGPAVDVALPKGAIQNGPDAVALVDSAVASIVPGDGLTTAGLLDALVYGPADAPDAGLRPLLAGGQAQRDEAERGDAAGHALQRCPNGAGRPRHSDAYAAGPSTPGATNACDVDAAPAVAATWPAPDAANAPLTATLAITFTEAVDADPGWFALTCDGAPGPVAETWTGATAHLTPIDPLPAGATCQAEVRAPSVHDRDGDDPPDTPAADHAWTFHTAPPPVVAAFDSDSPVAVGRAVHFRNASAGPAPLAFRWAFGDGAVATDPHPSHAYAAPGRYLVTLLVTAGPITATARGEVVVLAAVVYLPVVR